MFKVGQRVICVDANPGTQRHLFKNWVEESEVYTVRECTNLMGLERVLLDQISNPPVLFSELMGKAEPGFAARRFVDAEEYVLESVSIESITKDIEVPCVE